MSILVNTLPRLLFGAPDVRFRAWLQLAARFRERGSHRLARFATQRMKRYGVYISPRAVVPSRTDFPHPTAIVIGEGVTFGEGVRVFQSVTIGGARLGDWQAGRYPSIGAGTTIFAGAVIIGAISIGKNCVIGANSVVLTDIPDNSTCVGSPARVTSSTVAYETKRIGSEKDNK